MDKIVFDQDLVSKTNLIQLNFHASVLSNILQELNFKYRNTNLEPNDILQKAVCL